MPQPKKHHICHNLRLALIAGTLLMSACEKDVELTVPPTQKTDAIIFNIEQSEGWESDVIGDGEASEGAKKASYTRSSSLPLECSDGDSLFTDFYMFMTEEDCPPMIDTLQSVTRNGESATPPFGVYTYQVTATTAPESYVPGKATPFMNNINLATYGTPDNEYKYWPGSGSWLKFFAYYPHSTKVSKQLGDKASNFTLEGADGQPTFTYTVPTDPDKQVDLMDGASELIEGSMTQTVQIALNHTLSQIQVKAGTIDDQDNIKIMSISFNGIKTTGTREMASANSWQIATDVTTNYEQTFTEGATIGADKMVGKPMYLMPQTLSDDATIVIKMQATSTDPSTEGTRTHEYTLTKKLKDFTPEWKADKKYTFTISSPEEVEVSVDDKVEEIDGKKVKKDLEIKNCGLASAYIRVSISGSWVTTATTGIGESATTQKIYVDAWKDSDGTFVWGNNGVEPTTTTPNNNWLKSEDGYYYYMGPVKRNTVLKKLFDSYTLTAQPPVANAHLELIILAEAIYEGDFETSGWFQAAETAETPQP